MSARRRGSGTLVFDGDCGFCTTSAGWARRIAPGVETVAWQLTDLDALAVSADAAAAEVQYVDAGGRVSGGATAIARLLLACGGLLGLLGRLMLMPGVRLVAAWTYKLVAANRYRLPGGTPACRITS
jgi:predicted DCC family thiol-disulfide oxidoreductase YuxK